MSHFTALLQSEAGQDPLSSCSHSISHFATLVSSSLLPQLFWGNVCLLPLSPLSLSFFFTEPVQLIDMQPSGRNESDILDSLHSHGKCQGHVCTVRPQRKSSEPCLQLHRSSCSNIVLSEGGVEKIRLSHNQNVSFRTKSKPDDTAMPHLFYSINVKFFNIYNMLITKDLSHVISLFMGASLDDSCHSKLEPVLTTTKFRRQSREAVL